jgi:hypothetical protein
MAKYHIVDEAGTAAPIGPYDDQETASQKAHALKGVTGKEYVVLVVRVVSATAATTMVEPDTATPTPVKVQYRVHNHQGNPVSTVLDDVGLAVDLAIEKANRTRYTHTVIDTDANEIWTAFPNGNPVNPVAYALRHAANRANRVNAFETDFEMHWSLTSDGPTLTVTRKNRRWNSTATIRKIDWFSLLGATDPEATLKLLEEQTIIKVTGRDYTHPD